MVEWRKGHRQTNGQGSLPQARPPLASGGRERTPNVALGVQGADSASADAEDRSPTELLAPPPAPLSDALGTLQLGRREAVTAGSPVQPERDSDSHQEFSAPTPWKLCFSL